MIVILGFIYRFNTAFRQYTVDLYGNYYRCLLETGALPGTGSICSNNKAAFDLGNGKPLVTNNPGPGSGGDPTGPGTRNPGGGSGGGNGSNPGGRGGSGGSGGRSSAGSSGGGGSGDSSGSGSDDSGRGNESVGTSNGGANTSVGRALNLGRQSSTAVGSLGKEGDGEDGRRDKDAAKLAIGSARASSDGLRRGKTNMEFSMDGGEYQRAETAAVAPLSASSAKRSARDQGDSLRPRTAVENINRTPAKANSDDGGSFSFGRIFRIFLILAVIVAIVVFIGGQVLQISKSGER